MKRCDCCKKKSLVDMKCKCEKTFCITCRFPDVHKCLFDHKAESRKLLEKNNPIVVGNKVDKI